MSEKLKTFIKNVRLFNYLWRRIDWIRTKHLLKKDIHSYINKIYRRNFKRDINWENPVNLIEKIYWMQIYTDTSLWTRCSDKYIVREYVKEKGCEETLNTLYGKWDNAEDIDWDSLPESFVLKTNNSCGQVILVRNNKELDIPKTINQLNYWLNLNYGYKGAQLHYTKIKPCIIAEELFENKNNPKQSLVDYKIWCFNGVPECVLVVYNRSQNGYSLLSYDLEWNNISEKTFKLDTPSYIPEEVPKPKSLDQMIKYSKILSKGILQVRVDFYDIDGEAVFGEMTFTTGYGYYSDEYYDYLGSKIDLNMVKKLDQPNSPF